MILTVTANVSLDRVLFIPELVPGNYIYTERVVDAVGGKGLDASVALSGLGVDTLALGFVAGPTGRQLVDLLDHYGVRHDLIEVEGDTRIAHVIMETSNHRDSHITTNNGYRVDVAAVGRLLARVRSSIAHSSWMVTAGSLPAGAPADLHAQIVCIAKEAGIGTLVDCFGPPMQHAVQAAPTVAKMNRSELAKSFGISAPTLPELGPAVHGLACEHGLGCVVITGGAEGMLGVTSEATLLAAAPRQNAVNGAGSGDAASAAIAWRLAVGDCLAEALRWAAAAGAAAALTERTAELHRADVDRLYPLVTVQTLES